MKCVKSTCALVNLKESEYLRVRCFTNGAVPVLSQKYSDAEVELFTAQLFELIDILPFKFGEPNASNLAQYLMSNSSSKSAPSPSLTAKFRLSVGTLLSNRVGLDNPPF